MKKAERQRLIKQLIMQQEIETQDELITRLEEIGVRATQATVSRDIREMSIVKTHGADGRVKYAIFSQAQGTSRREITRISKRFSCSNGASTIYCHLAYRDGKCRCGE